MEIFLILSLSLLLFSIVVLTGNDDSKLGTITFIISFISIIVFNVWFMLTEVRTYKLPITTGYIGDKPIVQFYTDPITSDRVVLEEKLKPREDYIECRIPRKYSLQHKICAPVTPILTVNKI